MKNSYNEFRILHSVGINLCVLVDGLLVCNQLIMSTFELDIMWRICSVDLLHDSMSSLL